MSAACLTAVRGTERVLSENEVPGVSGTAESTLTQNLQLTGRDLGEMNCLKACQIVGRK